MRAWGSGLYGAAATVYPFAPGVYLFFPTLMEYDTGLCYVQFASSRDGIHLDRRFRQAYVPIDPAAKRLGRQVAYNAYMGPGVIRVGDEIWMYGCEQDTPHDAHWHGRRVPGGVHRYVQRLDGFVSLDVDSGYRSGGHGPVNHTGRVVTKPFVLRGKVLEVNADATFCPGDEPHSKKGSVVVEALDSEDQVLAESEPISEDGVALRATWKGGHGLGGLVGRVIRLRFTMRMAKLYAFQIADAEPVPRSR